MLEGLITILFFLLIVGASMGFKALFALIGWTGKFASLTATACGIVLIFGGLALASLISDGTIKIGRKRKNDE